MVLPVNCCRLVVARLHIFWREICYIYLHITVDVPLLIGQEYPEFFVCFRRHPQWVCSLYNFEIPGFVMRSDVNAEGKPFFWWDCCAVAIEAPEIVEDGRGRGRRGLGCLLEELSLARIYIVDINMHVKS